VYEDAVAYLLGVFFAWVTILAARPMKPKSAHRFFTVVMVAVALLFVGFPAEQGHQAGVVAEAVALVAFLFLAGLGMVLHPVWLAVAYVAHGGWDLAYLLGWVPSYKPDWTVQFCVPYDWVVAGYLFTQVRGWQQARSATAS
jgi:hypothetical protein